MAWLTTALRRSLWLVLIAAAGGAVWSWRRDGADAATPVPAEWPPLSTPKAKTTAGTATTDTTTSPDATTSNATSSNSVAPIVNALVDAPEADRSSVGWAEPLADGSCPSGYPVKANDNSGIFHMPGGRFYDRTKAERCYSDAESAIADGYRRAKN